MVRRSTPPQVALPEVLADHVDLALHRVAGSAETAAGLAQTAVGVLSRLEIIRKLRIILDDTEGVLIAWCVEDAQVAQPLLGDVLDLDASTISRRSDRYRARLREIVPGV